MWAKCFMVFIMSCMLAVSRLMVVESLAVTQLACHADVHMHHGSYTFLIYKQVFGSFFNQYDCRCLHWRSCRDLSRSASREGWVKARLDTSRPGCICQCPWSPHQIFSVLRGAGALPWDVHGPVVRRGYTGPFTCFSAMGSCPPPHGRDEVSSWTAMVCGIW